MDTIALLGSTMGLGMVAGVRLYATVLTVGLGVRFGLFTLNPELSRLSVLTNPYILVAAGIAFLFEFFADKIPLVHSLWDSIHTFIRPIGGAVLGATAIGTLEPTTSIIIGILCGGTALSSHLTKAGTRILAEPLSNIVLSLFEDVLAFVGVWLSINHPAFMFGIVVLFLFVFFWIAPKLFRLIRVETLALLALLQKFFAPKHTELVAGTVQPAILDEMPEEFSDHFKKTFGNDLPSFAIKCVASKGVKRLRNSIGYLCVTNGQLIFITKRWFRFRTHVVDRALVSNFQFKKKLLLDRISFEAQNKKHHFYFFKDRLNRPENTYIMLKTVLTDDEQQRLTAQYKRSVKKKASL